MIEEATVDAYGDAEQLTGLFTMLEEHLAVPFTTTVLGVEVTVRKVDLTDDDTIVAICSRGRERQRIDLLEANATATPHRSAGGRPNSARNTPASPACSNVSNWPDSMVDTIRPTAAQAQASLHAVLHLVAAGRLRCSETTRRPAAAANVLTSVKTRRKAVATALTACAPDEWITTASNTTHSSDRNGLPEHAGLPVATRRSGRARSVSCPSHRPSRPRPACANA